MGQTESTEAPQTPPNTENIKRESISSLNNHYYVENFSALERYSLQNTFENLASKNNGKEIIEEETFIVSIKKCIFNFKSTYIDYLVFF
jgi:hypothetical protein